jgi:hypothetical protein
MIHGTLASSIKCEILSNPVMLLWFETNSRYDCVVSPDRGLIARLMGNPPVGRALVRRARVRLNYKFQRILLAKLLLTHAYLAEFCLLVVLTANYLAILSRFIQVILVTYIWKLTSVNRVNCRKAILIWIEYFWLLTRSFSSRNACEQTRLCILL